jgi:hypothetical protein
MLHRYHELSCGDQLVANLRWVEVLGSLAKVESTEGKFTMKRRGFLNPSVSVRDADFDTEFATLKINLFSGGRLIFADGREFTFTSLRFWNYEWVFKDEGGGMLFSIRRRSSIKHCGDVLLLPEAKLDRRLFVAIAVAWYALVIASEEAAAIAAGA